MIATKTIIVLFWTVVAYAAMQEAPVEYVHGTAVPIEIVCTEDAPCVAAPSE